MWDNVGNVPSLLVCLFINYMFVPVDLVLNHSLQGVMKKKNVWTILLHKVAISSMLSYITITFSLLPAHLGNITKQNKLRFKSEPYKVISEAFSLRSPLL